MSNLRQESEFLDVRRTQRKKTLLKLIEKCDKIYLLRNNYHMIIFLFNLIFLNTLIFLVKYLLEFTISLKTTFTKLSIGSKITLKFFVFTS